MCVSPSPLAGVRGGWDSVVVAPFPQQRHRLGVAGFGLLGADDSGVPLRGDLAKRMPVD